MPGYYFTLALRSLQRSRVLTALMVLAIGLGIGASMTMITVLHAMGRRRSRGRFTHLLISVTWPAGDGHVMQPPVMGRGSR
jgi:putative ABC transport system permease protein